MYIGFTQDRNEFLKIKRLENYQGDYYENTSLPNVDRGTRYLLMTVYIISFSSLFFYFTQHSLLVLYKHTKILV
jgi:hypothetical protein